MKYVQSGYIFAQSVANGVGCYPADEALGDVCPVYFLPDRYCPPLWLSSEINWRYDDICGVYYDGSVTLSDRAGRAIY